MMDISVHRIRYPRQSSPSLIQFLNTELRPKADLSVYDEFPSLFREYPGGQSVYIEKNGKVVSHVGYLVREFQHTHFRMRIGLIGSVTTDPAFRGQGLASQLIREAVVDMKRQGCVIAMLWSDKDDFYHPLGFCRAGIETDLRFSLDSVGDAPEPAKELKGPDPCAIWRMYQRHELKVDRSLEEQKLLLKVPRIRVFATERAGNLTSYLIVNKGADFTDYIHEWGGDMEALKRNIAYCQRHYFPKSPLTLISPSQVSIAPLRAIAEESWTGVLGLMRLIEPQALMGIYVEYLKHLNIAHHWVRETGVLRIESKEWILRKDQDILLMVFGRGDQHEYGSMKKSPSLPFFLWGFDSI